MLPFLLFLQTFLAPGTDSPQFCIGKACDGDSVYMAYLEKHPLLECPQKGITVKSFLLSFQSKGVLHEIPVQGAYFGQALAKMHREIDKGSLIYADNIIYTTADGKTGKTGARFRFSPVPVRYAGEFYPRIRWGNCLSDSVSLKRQIGDSLIILEPGYRVLSFRLFYGSGDVTDVPCPTNRIPYAVLSAIMQQGGGFLTVSFENILLRHESGRETVTEASFRLR